MNDVIHMSGADALTRSGGVSRMNYADSVKFLRKWCAENDLSCLASESADGRQTSLEIGDAGLTIIVDDNGNGYATVKTDRS